MKMIDSIRKMSSELVDDLKWPFRRAAIERAAASFTDDAASERIDLEQKVIDLRKSLTSASESEAKQLFLAIIEARIALEEAEKVAKLAEAEKAYLWADVPTGAV